MNEQTNYQIWYRPRGSVWGSMEQSEGFTPWAAQGYVQLFRTEEDAKVACDELAKKWVNEFAVFKCEQVC
jgi:hypothetical protein